MSTEAQTDSELRAIAGGLSAALERAWNTADGEAFAAPFTADADFVDTRGVVHRTRAVIARGHQGIFATIYKGSKIHYEVLDARLIAPGCLLAHVRGTLNAPSGPLAGEHTAVLTLVSLLTGGAWQITAFHNTLVTA